MTHYAAYIPAVAITGRRSSLVIEDLSFARDSFTAEQKARYAYGKRDSSQGAMIRNWNGIRQLVSTYGSSARSGVRIARSGMPSSKFYSTGRHGPRSDVEWDEPRRSRARRKETTEP